MEGGERRQPVRGVAPRTPGRAKESGPAGGAPRRGGRMRVDGCSARWQASPARHLRHEPRAAAQSRRLPARRRWSRSRRPAAGGPVDSLGRLRGSSLLVGAGAGCGGALAPGAGRRGAGHRRNGVGEYRTPLRQCRGGIGSVGRGRGCSSRMALRYQKSIQASAQFKTQSTGIRKNGYDHPQSGYAWAP